MRENIRSTLLLVGTLFVTTCAHKMPAPPGAQDESMLFQVKVKEGETLQSVGEQYAVPPSTLQRINHLAIQDEIKPGQIIYIPVSEKAMQSADLRGKASIVKGVIAVPGAEEVEDSKDGRGRRAELYTQYRQLAWPMDGSVSSSFGRRQGRAHKGIDIIPSSGIKQDIKAASQGVVEFVGKKSRFGLTVVINHRSFKTLYAHCSKIYVKEGQTVEKGETLALVGHTGNAEGTHLHFEYHTLANRALDPMPHFKREIAH